NHRGYPGGIRSAASGEKAIGRVAVLDQTPNTDVGRSRTGIERGTADGLPVEGRDYTRYRGEVRLALTTAESVLSFVLAAVIFIAFLAYVTISDLIQWRTLGKEKEEERGQWPPPCPLCD